MTAKPFIEKHERGNKVPDDYAAWVCQDGKQQEKAAKINGTIAAISGVALAAGVYSLVCGIQTGLTELVALIGIPCGGVGLTAAGTAFIVRTALCLKDRKILEKAMQR